MSGYKKVCHRIEEGLCEQWQNRSIFENACSIDYGATCVFRPGPLGTNSPEVAMNLVVSKRLEGMLPRDSSDLRQPSTSIKLPNLFTL